MDLLPWGNVNDLIKILRTTKKFYGQYAYKLVYQPVRHCFLFSSSKSVEDLISRCRRHQPEGTETIDFFLAYQDTRSDFKWRCEGSQVSIFAKTEEALYDLAVSRLKKHSNRLVSVTRIRDQKDYEILESGRIIMMTPSDYKYKVILRSGFKNNSDFKNLGNYLKSIRSEIKITDNLLSMLLHKNKYYHSHYFYVNDEKIISVLSMIAPTAIKRVQEVAF